MMSINYGDLSPFKEICRKICLNIPSSYAWQWDHKRDMAVIILDSHDAEMAFFPLFKEFSHHWNFSSSPTETPNISEWVNASYGLMPGQVFFTSHPLNDLVLFVAWWPWGRDKKVSMRVGLAPVDQSKPGDGIVFKYLTQWLDIADAPLQQHNIA